MDVTARFRADTSDFQKGAKRVKDDLDGVQGATKKSADGFTTMKGSLAAAFGIAAVGAITKAAGALQQFAAQAVEMARESEMTVRRLDAIAESMGLMDTVLGGSTQRLQDYAQELQNQTAVNDETIKSAQALILTFKDVASSAGEAGGVFDRTTVAALDLAAAGFGSVEGNARSLARALQDPTKGLTMLGRQGVTFTQQEQEKIKALVASNRLHEAQTLILSAVEKQVGGTAAATATSAAKMKASMDDVQESIGMLLLPAIDKAADIIRTEFLPAFAEFVQTHGPAIQNLFLNLVDDSANLAVGLSNVGTELARIGAAVPGGDDLGQAIAERPLQSILAAIPIIGTYATVLMNSGEETRKLESAQRSMAQANDLAAKRYQAMADAVKAAEVAAIAAATGQNQLTTATLTGATAAERLQIAFQTMQGVLGNRRAKDTAIKAAKDLEESLKKNGDRIRGESEAALNNRAAIDNLAQSYIQWAQQTEDPIKQQERLEKGQKKLRDILTAAGIDPEKDPVYRSLKKQAEQGADTVGELRKQVRDAQIAGADIGRSFVQGIVAEVQRRADEARKAGALAGEALEEGAREATETESPSKVAMRISADFIEGIKKGLNVEEAFAKASELGKAVVAGFEQEMGRIVSLVEGAANAGIELAEMVAKPFGTASQVMQNFGRTAGIPQIISGVRDITELIKQAYAPLVDRSIVGPAAARANRAAMNAQLGTLRQMGQQAVDLRNQYDNNVREMARLEQEYNKKVTGINEAFDALEAGAQANIDRVEAHYRSLIPTLQNALRTATDAFNRENAVLQRLISERDSFLSSIRSGFRSFVNNLRMESSAATKQIVRESRKMANGIVVSFEQEISTAGSTSTLRGALEQRLTAVRDFAANIRTLMARGLDASLVQEFVSAGVSGAGDAAAELVRASDEDLRAINATQAGLAAEIASFQQYATQQWHDAGIAQQEAVVAPLRAAADAAQAALDAANTAREAELAAARAHLQRLRDDRKAALDLAKKDHEAEMALLAADNLRLEGEMDQLAADLDAMLTNLAMTLPPKAFAAGQMMMRQLRAGFAERFPAVSGKLNAMMTALAESMNRVSTITIRTVYESIGSPIPRAMGGSVSANDVYLVGERGPEIFVPGASGNIIPNHQLAPVPSMGSPMGYGGGGTVINVNVSAPPLTDPAEVGRQAVEAIRKYERRSGPVFVSAS